MLARSVLRASSRVAVAPAAFKVARASITTAAKLGADPFTPQAQVPTSAYTSGEVQRSTLNVTGGGIAIENNEEADRVAPLSREVYNSMPRNMQKMTLMDKVVVVTG
jgi:hypothetical protein